MQYCQAPTFVIVVIQDDNNVKAVKANRTINVKDLNFILRMYGFL